MRSRSANCASSSRTSRKGRRSIGPAPTASSGAGTSNSCGC
nr:MAG TPA_asm: hypothetical protein [Caudoviricetes sp.]